MICSAEDCKNEATRSCNQCSGCCECNEQCSNCSDCCSSTCEHCDECEGCCSCDTCGSCARLTDCNVGDGCGYCSMHCSCNDSEDEEAEYTSGAPFLDPRPKLFRCSRLAGVEWEHNEYVDLSSWRKKWRGGYHEDGSCGWEAVTAPIAGDNIAACLTDLGVLLNKYSPADNACGIHVHVDAGDMSWTDMYRLLWVYAKVEPVLYLLAGQHRAKSPTDGSTHYCEPIGKAYRGSLAELDRKGSVLAVALGKGHTEKSAKRKIRCGIAKKDGGRYRGLNILPWIAGKRRGHTRPQRVDSTVEFRMHKNTLDSSRVIAWTQLCVRLVEWCATHTDAEAQNLPDSALRALCEVIAPDCAKWILKRVGEWRAATAISSRGTGKRRVPRYISVQGGSYALKVA